MFVHSYMCLCICYVVRDRSLKVFLALSGSSRKDVHMLFPEEEKIIVEETRSNGQTVMEERWEIRDEDVFTVGVCVQNVGHDSETCGEKKMLQQKIK